MFYIKPNNSYGLKDKQYTEVQEEMSELIWSGEVKQYTEVREEM
jgi:hypothetical protein